MNKRQTLAQWSEKSPLKVRQHKNGAWYVPDALPSPLRTELWDLEDYQVVSVTGGTVWLMERFVKPLDSTATA